MSSPQLGRPRTGKERRVRKSIAVEPLVWAAIEREAERAGISASQYINNAVASELIRSRKHERGE